MSNAQTLVNHRIQNLLATLVEINESPLSSDIEVCIQMIVDSINSGNKILIAGNGGSASDSQHFAAELVCRYQLNRQALPAIALTADSATLTAIGNDLGYKRIFSRQLSALANQGDVFIGISTSATSPNILHALEVAKDLKCKVILLTGNNSVQLDCIDQVISVPASETALIQEVHTVLIHTICESVEKLLA